MPTVDFLPFAVGGAANVEAQAAYAAETALLTNGFVAGVAPSAKFNKALRQASIIANVLAQYIAQETGQNVIDDGTTATILANLTAAINPGALLVTNGQQELPSGLIIKWGSTSVLAGGSPTVTFPLAFPNACLNAVANSSDNGATSYRVSAHTLSAASMKITSTATVTITATYIAIGF